MRVMFVGHFSNSNDVQTGFSAAGDTVQRSIVISLKEAAGPDIYSIAQPSAQTWPKGRLLFRSSKDSYAEFPSFINISLIRDLIFSLSCLKMFISRRPDVVVQYNSYFFVNLAVLFASFLLGFKKIIIIQDYRVGNDFKFSAKFHDKVSGLFVKFYDFVLPVTDALATKLKVGKRKFSVFPGAMESSKPYQLKYNVERDRSKDSVIVLYAGALESYNGVDRLLDVWPSIKENVHLVIYGKGSLMREVEHYSQRFKNIHYKGFATKEEVHKKMLVSDFNVCLRYAKGIDERFFFPSKFFSINCYPGFALVNEFYGLPEGFKSIGLLVDSDLENLPSLFEKNIDFLRGKTRERQDYLFSKYRWAAIFKGVLSGFDNTKPPIC